MVTPIELGLVVLAIVAVVIAYSLLKKAKALAVNAIVGVLILLAGKFLLGIGVNISIWAVLVCAIAGIPGAILVLILAWLDVAFVAALVPTLGLVVV